MTQNPAKSSYFRIYSLFLFIFLFEEHVIHQSVLCSGYYLKILLIYIFINYFLHIPCESSVLTTMLLGLEIPWLLLLQIIHLLISQCAGDGVAGSLPDPPRTGAWKDQLSTWHESHCEDMAQPPPCHCWRSVSLVRHFHLAPTPLPVYCGPLHWLGRTPGEQLSQCLSLVLFWSLM